MVQAGTLDELRRKMREDWDARAHQDAKDYIAIGHGDDFLFGLTGLRDANTILEDVYEFLDKDMAVLEIGCGIGRLLRFFSLLFTKVYGIDVAPEMIRKSKKYLAAHPNVETFCGDGSGLEPIADGSIGFVFSCAVFQHIPSKEVIREYIHEARRVMVPGGVFKCLVKYKSWEEGEVVGTWHGVNVAEADIDTWREETGFEYVKGYSVDEHVAWMLLRAPE